ncbi:MAG: hypothetical protein ACT4P1_05620 [Sporichthyaceae bacterium]
MATIESHQPEAPTSRRPCVNPEFDDDQHLAEAFDASREPVWHAPGERGFAEPQTGDGRVDAVVAALSTLAELPTSDHVGVFDEVHRGLQDALATLAEA